MHLLLQLFSVRMCLEILTKLSFAITFEEELFITLHTGEPGTDNTVVILLEEHCQNDGRLSENLHICTRYNDGMETYMVILYQAHPKSKSV